MRVATANSYDNTIAALNKRQADLTTLQEHISTGKRVQRASDDPVAAVLSETAQNRLSRVEADKRSLEASVTSLTQAESALGDAGELIQDVRDLLVAAGNGGYSGNEYKDLAQQIEGLRERLLGVVNQKDSFGRTLFGGLGGSSTPFVELYGPSGAGVVRFDGQRGQEATGANSLPQALDGNAIWMRVPEGNGTFRIDLPAGNTGSVRTDMGQVTNPSALTGNDYSIGFAQVAGVMQYTVTNTTTGTPVAGQVGVPYMSGSSIEFDGMSFQMLGQPASGDTVELHPVTAPTDLFQVMQNAVDALRADRFDLVLMDAMMPVMDGVEAVRLIRAEEAAEGRPRTPIHMLTSKVFEDDVARYRAAGADGVLGKPIQIGALQALLEQTAASAVPA